jgi:hypothetical protein
MQATVNRPKLRAALALASFEAALGFVNHVQTATTANNLAIAMARAQRLDGILHFHGTPVYLVCI